jgi:hypothetical protein
MFVHKSWLAAAFAGSLIWIAGSANPLSAEEAATTISPPALRVRPGDACRIVSPTFAPNASHESVAKARYPGGGKLSFAVAAPCPERSVAFDI